MRGLVRASTLKPDPRTWMAGLRPAMTLSDWLRLLGPLLRWVNLSRFDARRFSEFGCLLGLHALQASKA